MNPESSGDVSSLIQEPGNLMLGIVMGLLAAMVGAAIWAVITVLTGYQIGWMAIGVGFLVGIAVRQFGRGATVAFSVAGAALALLGCVAGNLLAVVGFISKGEAVGFFSVLGQVDLGTAANLLVETASPIDFLFYAIAVYEGFKLSVVTPAVTAEAAT